jgi:NAD(P)-dependent dehydrogenase (short-subunit alcohol dehydrogenase family)
VSAIYSNLAGRVVFVTGGASGIGADIVRAFASHKAKTVFVDIQDDTGNALAAELGATYLHCDVTDIAALQQTIRNVGESIGPIGVLVNNAANDERHKIDDVTVEYWDNSQEVNLRHQFFAAQAVRAQMKSLGGGSIINFSSITWRGGADTIAVYAVAKAGVVGLTHSLAREFGKDNIRVNAIEPGAVITERQRRLWYKDQAAVDFVVSRQAINRMLLGDEVARLVLFLASDESRMITKQSITIDAGLR